MPSPILDDDAEQHGPQTAMLTALALGFSYAAFSQHTVAPSSEAEFLSAASKASFQDSTLP